MSRIREATVLSMQAQDQYYKDLHLRQWSELAFVFAIPGQHERLHTEMTVQMRRLGRSSTSRRLTVVEQLASASPLVVLPASSLIETSTR